MMTTITTGTKAIDTRDGRTVTIGAKNSKCKTVIVFYDEPTEKEVNGKSMSFSTVKKNFDLQVWESDAETEEKETYDVVREHDMLTDEVEEITAPEAEKTEKKEKKTKKAIPTYDALVTLLPVFESNTNIIYKAGVGSRANSVIIKQDKKRICRVAGRTDGRYMIIIKGNRSVVEDIGAEVLKVVNAFMAK